MFARRGRPSQLASRMPSFQEVCEFELARIVPTLLALIQAATDPRLSAEQFDYRQRQAVKWARDAAHYANPKLNEYRVYRDVLAEIDAEFEAARACKRLLERPSRPVQPHALSA